VKNLSSNIQSMDINKITKNDILKMYEIERDTWSHFMWEYVKCEDCNVSFSKKDIYWEIENYNTYTVNELENEYWRNNIKCNCCWGDTKDIRWEELLSILESRIFSTKQWFVNFYKSSVDEILGFTYWFIDSPEKTYEKEFSYHFSEKLLEKFTEKFWNNDLLTLSGVCIKPESQKVNIIYELIKQFHCSLNSNNDYLIWVWEAIVNTSAHKIYKKMWCNSFDIDNTYLKTDLSNLPSSEIVFQKNVVRDYRSINNMNMSEFLNYTKQLVQKNVWYI